MLRFMKSFFGKFRTQETATEVEHKVDTPVQPEPAKCGCGRSSTGFCVGLHRLTAEQWAAHPDNSAKPVVETVPAKVETAKKKPAVKKTPAAKKETATKKPAAIKAKPSSGTRKPVK